MTEKRPPRSKVQFDLSVDAEQELDALQELAGATTRVDLIRRAISFYSWFIHDVDVADTLQVVTRDGTVKTSFPARLIKNAIKPF